MMTMNEEEGFVEQASTEYTEYSYSPCLAFRETQSRRAYFNPLKLKSSPKPVFTPQAFINNDLQELLASQFASSHPAPIYRPTGLPIDGNLSFDSGFESGNLQYVLSQAKGCFQLYIKPDSNTMTHFQWFYFRVRSKRPVTVTLSIKNFLKQKMSYSEGLRPFHRSSSGIHKNYEQISNPVSFGPAESDSELDFYQMTFEYSFSAEEDVQFCSQPPYPYSRYCKIYKGLPFPRLEISRTVLGNKIEAFVINQQSNTNTIVVAMARQHPGESVGSWLMEGFVNKLVETQNNFTWVLIPMVNIDGVVLGNNRTGVQGYDFNRHWYIDEETNRYHLFPELKGIITYFNRKRKEHARKIKIFIDFHGHSSEQNVFAYGPPHFKTSQYYELSKVFPFLINKRNPDFSLKQSSYHLQPYKKGCSRSVFLHKFGFPYSYTIQSSFGLYRGRRINEQDILKIGEDVLTSVVEFATILTDNKEKGNSALREILGAIKDVGEAGIKPGGYDSDSENQDESAPIRRNFEQKLVGMLTKEAQELEGSLFSRLAKKRDNVSYLERDHSKHVKPTAVSGPSYPSRKSRMRTEESRKTPQTHEHFLPKVKWEQKERRTRSSKKSIPLCDLDRLSLQEMKERLMKMKHSELGRRILIIDSHQNS